MIKIKIILLKDIKSFGKKDEIKEVKDGYGKFLINKKDAVIYSNKSFEILNTQLEERKTKEQLEIKSSEEIKQKIEKLELSFTLKVGVNNKVFGVVTPKMISEELLKNGINVDKKKIESNTQLNTIGKHNINIILHKKVSAVLRIIVKS